MPSRMLAFLTLVAAGACGVAANPATTGPASDANVASNDAVGTGSNADTGDIFAYAALSVHYCQAVDDAHKLVSRVANVSPDQAGAYPCSLSLTFSNIPLCSDYTPAAPFQLLTLSLGSVAPATYGLADLAQGATASPLAYAQRDTYGDPSWCSHQQPLGGALCALGSGVYNTAGSVTIAAFVDGGSGSKSQLSGSLSGIVLPAVPGRPGDTPSAPGVPAFPAVGPVDMQFNASTCGAGLQGIYLEPASTLPVPL